MSWIIPPNSFTRRDKEFLDKCKDDAVNKSIPIIDESDTKYLPCIEDSLPIPIIIEDKKEKQKKAFTKREDNIINYISSKSKENKEILDNKVVIITPKYKKRKRNNND